LIPLHSPFWCFYGFNQLHLRYFFIPFPMGQSLSSIFSLYFPFYQLPCQLFWFIFSIKSFKKLFLPVVLLFLFVFHVFILLYPPFFSSVFQFISFLASYFGLFSSCIHFP
jgi:hypothetical protein